ncbi:MAG TPA: hypothetical protein DEB25_06415 [Desulfobulbaceae bacterium]|nr:hypothetical protein [Desulfobulbaceae bacterium]
MRLAKKIKREQDRRAMKLFLAVLKTGAEVEEGEGGKLFITEENMMKALSSPAIKKLANQSGMTNRETTKLLQEMQIG